jgi:hypothetical protein
LILLPALLASPLGAFFESRQVQKRAERNEVSFADEEIGAPQSPLELPVANA